MSDYPLFDWAVAQRKGDLGMTRAVERADRVEPDWSARAYEALVAYALQCHEFTAEEARVSIHNFGLPLPPDGRAWGAVFKRAAAESLIIKIGYAPRHCGNMTPTIVWATRSRP